MVVEAEAAFLAVLFIDGVGDALLGPLAAVDVDDTVEGDFFAAGAGDDFTVGSDALTMLEKEPGRINDTDYDAKSGDATLPVWDPRASPEPNARGVRDSSRGRARLRPVARRKNRRFIFAVELLMG